MKKVLFATACLFTLHNQCLATDVNLFVGANVGVTGIMLGNELKKTEIDGVWDVPTSYFGVGAEFGARFFRDDVYNCGLVLGYDYMFDSKTNINDNYKPYISYSKVGFSALSAVFDNYVRISGRYGYRQDIVIGVGLANVTERLYFSPTALGVTTYNLEYVDERDDGLAAVLKLAYNVRIGNHEGYVSGKYFYTGEKDVDSMFNLNIGIRYLF